MPVFQSAHTVVCGQYCIYVAYWLARNVSFRDVLSRLRRVSNVAVRRDRFVYKFVQEKFRAVLRWPVTLFDDSVCQRCSRRAAITV